MSYYGLLELIRALVKSKYPKEKVEESFQSINDLYGIGALKNVRIEEVLYLVKDIEIECNLYASDALHVACAVQCGCRILV
jgi:predicted nucleic acid-binding protein